MNIALEKTEEYVDGVLKQAYGDAFVRGNNGFSLQVLTITEDRPADQDVVLYISAD